MNTILDRALSLTGRGAVANARDAVESARQSSAEVESALAAITTSDEARYRVEAAAGRAGTAAA